MIRKQHMIKGACLVFFCCLSITVFADAPKLRSLELDCEVEANDIPDSASTLKVWFPQPPQTLYQQVQTLSLMPKDTLIAQDKTYNNKIIFYSFNHPKNSVKIKVKYKIYRYQYSKSTSPSFTQKDELSKYLVSNKLMIVSDEIRKIAAGITKGKNTAMEKARAIYDYVLDNVSYDKTIPGWGTGDTKRVCLLKAGNCTDFHSLFVSLARASNIPAKFVIGISLPKEHEGEVDNYHCWAEFYDEKLGWVPVDVSEAWKEKNKAGYYFGNINEDRVEFSQGRDIVLVPQCKCESLNYFFYPYAEVDGKSFKNIKVVFRFKDLTLRKGVED